MEVETGCVVVEVVCGGGVVGGGGGGGCVVGVSITLIVVVVCWTRIASGSLVLNGFDTSLCSLVLNCRGFASKAFANAEGERWILVEIVGSVTGACVRGISVLE